ncbi:glucokinase [Guyparkeria sp.]|uniref:glucokinase n=1 Tax=Guyparkeria sp. TaxID=2035736 RepID=UPI003561BB62
MILAGDIGGTRSRLAVFRAGEPHPVVERHLPSADYASLPELLDDFRQGLEKDRQIEWQNIESAAFGVAGPVAGQPGEEVARTTNLPWTVSAAQVRELLADVPVRIVNDLVAVGLGAMASPVRRRVALNPDATFEGGHVAVIAPGTGLGEAVFYHDGHRFLPMPSEGGHCDFAPNNAREDELLAFMRRRCGGHVSYERLLSGAGFSALYAFAREHELGRSSPDADRRLSEAEDRNAMVTRMAANGEDECAMIACRFFARILGAEAGNMALKTLPFGGVFIAGAIAGHVLPFLREETLTGFLDKGRFSTLLGRMPLWVVADSGLGLAGARELAEQERNG